MNFTVIFLGVRDPTPGFSLSAIGDEELLDGRCELRNFKKKLRKMSKKAALLCFVHNMQHLTLGVEFFKKITAQSLELF